MIYYYAQLDENNVCVGIHALTGEVEDARYTSIDSYDLDKQGRKYENSAWSEEKYAYTEDGIEQV